MVMFGQEPQLPIDCLLGTTEPLEPLTADEWTTSHRSAISQVYKETRQRLQIAADRRAKHHNAKVKGDNLQPGQLVFCCDHSHRGRHKIQNQSSVLYKVVCCPQD